MLKTYNFEEKIKRGKAIKDIVSFALKQFCEFPIEENYNTGKYSEIDGCKMTANGYVKPCKAWRKGLLYICHSQEVSGTAYRKIPYFVLNAKERVYPAPLLFIIGGDFYTKSAPGLMMFDWLKSNVDRETIVGVLSRDEFISWCERYTGSYDGLLQY